MIAVCLRKENMRRSSPSADGRDIAPGTSPTQLLPQRPTHQTCYYGRPACLWASMPLSHLLLQLRVTAGIFSRQGGKPRSPGSFAVQRQLQAQPEQGTHQLMVSPSCKGRSRRSPSERTQIRTAQRTLPVPRCWSRTASKAKRRAA